MVGLGTAIMGGGHPVHGSLPAVSKLYHLFNNQYDLIQSVAGASPATIQVTGDGRLETWRDRTHLVKSVLIGSQRKKQVREQRGRCYNTPASDCYKVY